MTRRALVVVAGALFAIACGVGVWLVLQKSGRDEARCGAGFVASGSRCCPENTGGSACIMHACPSPLALQNGVCDAPDIRVSIPDTTTFVGPSDWEAEGRVAPRVIHVAPFSIDAFEVTLGKFACPACPYPRKNFDASDAARAASSVTQEEARVFCASRGGRLPTDDEWVAAAAGDPPRRYPWGDTGAVCRRAAFALVDGPCAKNAEGPDTVGTHGLGDTSLGVHDLAGNVAEWVETRGAKSPGIRGGSYASSLATELRTWSFEEVPASARDPRIGFRCAYDRAERGPK